MLIRVQGRDGTKRISLEPQDTLRVLIQEVTRVFQFDPSQSFSIYRSKGYKDGLNENMLDTQLLRIPIMHGDLLYLREGEANETTPITINAVEDDIDQQLRKKDGKIYRQRDSQLCHHGPQGKCLNCAPLEPWDQQYLKTRDPPIKHLSFHCYLRRLTSGVDKGKFVNLEDLSCKIKTECTSHSPWPAGICTKCQPSAITLARQSYRHVDNIMFEDKAIVERFLEGWRKSGVQRMGFLFGRYEEYDEVPLGIKVVVAAIYEPPQSCTKYSIELLEDPHAKVVESMAKHLGLRKVGWIFTDLESENGKVIHKRHIHTHLLTAEECIMAADFQNSHPNPCSQSSSGYFGSKFVTVCVTGNESNQVDTTGYQVSNQCMALVRDDCLIPTLDAPELGYIRESTNEQYVPDVFYKKMNEYNSQVTKLARPLPVEYLIVELTTTTPLRPKATLPGGRGNPFPVENRENLGEVQAFDAFVSYLDKQKGTNFLCYMSDFHLLYFLYTTDVVQLQPHLPALCAAIHTQDRSGADEWMRQPWWYHVLELARATSVTTPTGLDPPPAYSGLQVPEMETGGGAVWACQYCTLENPSHLSTCSACGLPKN